MVVQKRVYVGNLINQPEACLEALEGRLAKFGECLGGFENHGSFAYMNMVFTDESRFNKLKGSFNHVKFKGNVLRVDAARAHWQWEEQKKKDDEEEARKQKQIDRNHWQYHKKIQNISMSWKDRRQVLQGRLRKAPRSKHQLRNITFRIDVNGSLKVYKCYKNKLWGYERNKEPQDLVFKFTRGQWRNGWDHILDRLNYARAKGVCRKPVEVGEEDDDVEEDIDKVTNSKVLEDMLKSFDFDKPIINMGDDEGDAMDTPKSRDNNEVTRPETQVDEIVSSSSVPVSQTEILRNLFDPQDNQPFKLTVDTDDDIDHEKDVVEEEILPVAEISAPIPASFKNTALFFPHFDSPFLLGQTQLSKLQGIQPNLELWQQEFWDHRGSWMKDMKRKRRDALRQFAKKRARNGSGFLV